MAFIKDVELVFVVFMVEYSLVHIAFGFVPPNLVDEKIASSLDEIIEKVNEAKSSWTAGNNFESDSSVYLEGLVSDIDPLRDLDPKTRSCDCGVTAKDLGAGEFDPRKKWPDCPTISHIHNQGACKSSWAVAAAAVISDRQCVASNGTTKAPMSAQHLLSCCGQCGDGCNGGWPRKAFVYYQKHGVVTGGAYNSKEGCQPFALEPSSNFNLPSDDNKETPQCAKECTNKQYSKSMKNDLHFGKGVITPCCCWIKDTLTKDGPVATSMVVYEDFFAYKSGVYRHIWGKKVGYQSVRLLGWGTENGEDYWLAANSWGPSWGEGGFFKILRGKGECQFDYAFAAPEPKIKNH